VGRSKNPDRLFMKNGTNNRSACGFREWFRVARKVDSFYGII
jgi:hypothetical protein